MASLALRCAFFALLAGPLASPVAADAAQWQWPLAQHRLAARFDFDRSDPYRAGARRGVTLSGDPGVAVRAVCSGSVSFAGLLPDGRRGVTLRCGPLAATEIGFGHGEVSRGEAVLAGQPLGSLGASGLLTIGARRWGERNGYSDPLELLAAAPSSLPLAPLAPRGRRTAPPRAAARAPLRAGKRPRSTTPWLLGAVWLGLGISGAAIGAGIALNGRRQRGAMRLAPAGRTQRQP